MGRVLAPARLHICAVGATPLGAPSYTHAGQLHALRATDACRPHPSAPNPLNVVANAMTAPLDACGAGPLDRFDVPWMYRGPKWEMGVCQSRVARMRGVKHMP